MPLIIEDNNRFDPTWRFTTSMLSRCYVNCTMKPNKTCQIFVSDLSSGKTDQAYLRCSFQGYYSKRILNQGLGRQRNMGCTCTYQIRVNPENRILNMFFFYFCCCYSTGLIPLRMAYQFRIVLLAQ